MKRYLACVVLCAAISLISLGIHNDDAIFIIIGGALAGVYNAMIQTKLKEK